MVVAGLDVEQAFDTMDHIEMDETNKARKVNLNARIAALKDYINKAAKAKLNGVGVTEDFEVETGGRQGGVRTPDEWKYMLKRGFTKPSKKWTDEGVGFKMSREGLGEPDSYDVINLEIFADNIYIFAGSSDQMQVMIDEVTVEMHKMRLRWKPGPMKDGAHTGPNYMTAGALRKVEENNRQPIHIQTSKGRKQLEFKNRLEVLGSLITDDNDDKAAMEFRQAKAEKTILEKLQKIPLQRLR